MTKSAIAAVAMLLALTACGEPDPAAPEGEGGLCAAVAAACSTMAACDYATAYACGYGRGAEGGYGCGFWVTHTAADCPTPYVICRAADASNVLCPRL